MFSLFLPQMSRGFRAGQSNTWPGCGRRSVAWVGSLREAVNALPLSVENWGSAFVRNRDPEVSIVSLCLDIDCIWRFYGLQGNFREGNASGRIFIVVANSGYWSQGVAQAADCLQIVEERLHKAGSDGHHSVLQATNGSTRIRAGWVIKSDLLNAVETVIKSYTFYVYSDINGVTVCFKLSACTHREAPSVPPIHTHESLQFDLGNDIHYQNVISKQPKPVSIV